MEKLTPEAIEFYEAILRIAEAKKLPVQVKLPEMRDFLAAARAAFAVEETIAELQRILAVEEALLRKALRTPGGVTRSGLDETFGRLWDAIAPLAASRPARRMDPNIRGMARN
jgi:hypothetical protein